MLIFVMLIICVLVAYSYVKKNADTPEMRQKQFNQWTDSGQVYSEHEGNQYVSSVNRQALQTTGNQYQQTFGGKRQVTAEDRRKLEEYRRKKGMNRNTYAAPQRQMEPVRDSKMEHSAELQAEKTFEEKVKEAEENVISGMDVTGSLGCVNDLIVTGYDGNMKFDRDFLAEAMDMLNSYTL